MKIVKHSLMRDGENKNILVKEQESEYPFVNRLDNPQVIASAMRDIFKLHMQAEEYVYLIVLNTKFVPISFFELSHGTIDASIIGIRELMTRVLLCCGSKIILVHNHISEECEPSKEDIKVTERIKKACEIMDIELCDHIIVGKYGYYSFVESERNNDEK